LDGADIIGSWIDQELAGCGFADAWLGKRSGVLMQLSSAFGRGCLPYPSWLGGRNLARNRESGELGTKPVSFDLPGRRSR